MPDLPNSSEQARAELLCHLVVGQLVARARTGQWLRTEHLVEWMHMKRAAIMTDVDWVDRAHLGMLSQAIALEFAALSGTQSSTLFAKLFTDDWQLDYSSEIVRNIHNTCLLHLRRAGRTL